MRIVFNIGVVIILVCLSFAFNHVTKQQQEVTLSIVTALKLQIKCDELSRKLLKTQLREDINAVSKSNASFYKELDLTCRQIKENSRELYYEIETLKKRLTILERETEDE